MSNELQTQEAGLPALTFTPDQVSLIKRTVAKGTSDDELALFLYTAKTTGLNPLLKQIHAVKRWDSKLNQEVMAIQVGIDGFRLIAERTRRYAPGRETVYAYNDDGSLKSATAFVKKYTNDGIWHEVSATAFYDEFVQKKKDGKPVIMWEKMPHSQLGKCAEANCIRKAFPAETAGTHVDEELGQAENPEPKLVSEPKRTSEVKPEPVNEASGDIVDAEVADSGTAQEPANGAVAVESITPVNGVNKTTKKPWLRWDIATADGLKYATFDERMMLVASRAKESGGLVRIDGKEGKFGLDLVSIQISAA